MITIKNEMKEKHITFRQVSIGDCFVFGEELYMKTDPHIDDVTNAVRLNTGMGCRFDDDERVTSVSVELKFW